MARQPQGAHAQACLLPHLLTDRPLLQGKLHISTDSGADGASPEGSVVDGASPMSLAAGADFADQVCDAWAGGRARHLHTSQQHVVGRWGVSASCAPHHITQSSNQHWLCAQELENLKTGGGGDAEAAAAAARLGEAASPQQSAGTEFSPQGRVVQLADLPASALPTTDSAPPVTAASASVKTISESAHSMQVRRPHLAGTPSRVGMSIAVNNSTLPADTTVCCPPAALTKALQTAQSLLPPLFALGQRGLVEEGQRAGSCKKCVVSPWLQGPAAAPPAGSPLAQGSGSQSPIQDSPTRPRGVSPSGSAGSLGGAEAAPFVSSVPGGSKTTNPGMR